jgi:type II secretory pathway pseudopilin PulG
MSLLVVIAILAIIGLLLGIFLPALLREMDVEVARTETATLKAYHDALKAGVLRESAIPDASGWTNLVASNGGVNAQNVAVNKRHQPRALLIDPSCNVTLPYTQGNAGLPAQPANVRMMIVSSLGSPLPVSNGQVLSTNGFRDLWNSIEGTANFPTSNGWAGLSRDVKIQRVDLTPYFLKLYVTTVPTLPEGWFAIGNNAPVIAPLNPLPPVRYVLQGTQLRLYHANAAVLDSTQVLNRQGSFKYENGVWKGDPSGAVMPGGIDLAAVTRAFLEAVPNLHAANGANQQRLIVQSFMGYMQNYNRWAAGSFTDNTLKAQLITMQQDMISKVQGLYLSSDNYYPYNNTTCP